MSWLAVKTDGQARVSLDLNNAAPSRLWFQMTQSVFTIQDILASYFGYSTLHELSNKWAGNFPEI